MQPVDSKPANAIDSLPSALLLDLDGTLIDSMPDIARYANLALAGVGLAQRSLAEVQAAIGDGAGELMERLSPQQAGRPEVQQQLLETFVSQYEANPMVETRLFPGVQAVLDFGLHRSVPMAIVSNKPERMCLDIVEQLNLKQALPVVLGEGSTEERKPSAQPIRVALERLGLDPKQLAGSQPWMIGDGIPDMQAGRAAGIHTCAVLWGYTSKAKLAQHQPDEFFENPEQLLARLESLVR